MEEKIVSSLTANTSKDMHWIIISETQRGCADFKARTKNLDSAKCTFVHPLSDLVQNRSQLASKVNQAAASAMCFTLIFDGEIKSEYYHQIYKLFFYLKNLGFSRVILMRGDDKKIAAFCHEFNVYYEALDTN